MPKQVEYFRFWIHDEISGKRRRTSFAMSRQQALERYFDDAVPDPTTREVRTVYEPGEAPGNTHPPHGGASSDD